MCRLALWAKLIEKNIEPAIILALMKFYNVSQMMIVNDDEMTKLFRTTVGIRQGGVVSPKLFNIYIELINKSMESGVTLGNLKINVLLYADDILILSHTKRGINKLLRLIEEYGSKYEIKFNSAKTYYMVFNKNAKLTKLGRKSEEIQPDPSLCGGKISKVSEMRYLGLEINDLNKNTSHLKKRRMLSYACLSRITTSGIYLKKQTNPRQIAQLYKTYIRPILCFGCENFFYEKTELAKISTVDGNILKTMIDIPIQCHITNLQLAFGMDTKTMTESISSIFIYLYINVHKRYFSKKTFIYF